MTVPAPARQEEPEQGQRTESEAQSRTTPREEPEQGQRGTSSEGAGSQSEWLKWCTIITAITVAIGIIFQAFLTFWTIRSSDWGIRVAQDQLEQSREDSDKEARKQARMVSIWNEDGDTVIVNRSPDVIYDVDLDYTVTWLGSVRRGYIYEVSIPFVPPCGLTRVKWEAVTEGSWTPDHGKVPKTIWRSGSRFVDADGVRWLRKFDGKLVEANKAERSSMETGKLSLNKNHVEIRGADALCGKS
ncbi:hypothetical protein [Streptomyces sp. NPDC094049]|uniref:hypothetical protein n=1 Tax=Streptomyces sp. NPDC094049 TaxID=3154987 RepID=UPI00331CAEAB